MKRKMTILAALLMSVMMIVVFTACGGSGGGDSEGSGDPTYDLKMATVHPAEHADTIAAQEAADEIAEKTNGDIKITIYPSAQLGDYTQVYEEIMKGTVDMADEPIPTNFDPRMEMLTIPYLTTNYEQAKKVYGEGSYFFELLDKCQGEQGVKLINIFFDGYMGIGTANPIEDPMAIGKKHKELIRVPAMDSYIWTAEAMGFNTTTIAYADLYSALQTGVADGWIGGSAYLNYESFRDVEKYYVDSKYIMELIPVVINKELYDGMPEEYQKIIMEAFAKAAAKTAEQREALDEQAMKDMADMGIEVYQPTQDELDAMKAHFDKTVLPKYNDLLGEDVVQKLLEDVSGTN